MKATMFLLLLLLSLIVKGEVHPTKQGQFRSNSITTLASATRTQVLPHTANYTVDGRLRLRDAQQLQRDINASLSRHEVSFTVPSGAYYFDDGSPLLLYQAKNFTLTGAFPGVELWFRVTSEWKTGGVLLLNCENVTVQNFTIDYDPPAYYQGTLMADAGPIGSLSSAAFVKTDPGFPEPHTYIKAHTQDADPSCNYVNDPAIWPKSIGFACNRTLGCPGHGAATLQPYHKSSIEGQSLFTVLPSAKKGDKITISIRKGITYHVQNSSNVKTMNVAIHSASLFGLSEFDGAGGHTWENIWLGRRPYLVNPETQLCGKPPGRLCFGVLASNADAFHSSGCRRGPTLQNVTLSNNFDDFLNIHSRLQLVGKRLSQTELIILDPRLAVAKGVPDDTPYGTAETMPNAQPGMQLEFYALNTLIYLGHGTIASVERLNSRADVAAASGTLNRDLDGRPPYNATPALIKLDVGQLCSAVSRQHRIPKCDSRVWKVTFTSPVPDAVTKYAISALRNWDASEASVENSQFFGGIDGIRWKSNHGSFSNNIIAATYFEVSPLQFYLEGPPHLHDIQVTNNTFSACGGLYGKASVNCSLGIPVWNNAGGFCGIGIEAVGTCTDMSAHGNVPAHDCCLFGDPGARYTCCAACHGSERHCGCCYSFLFSVQGPQIDNT